MAMVLSVLGVVLYVTLFKSVLDGAYAVYSYTYISTFTALQTVVQIAPTVLLLGGIFAAGFGYWKGLQSAGTHDPSGLMRMVLGVLVIVLFLSMFSTILSAMYTLYSSGNASYFTAFTTVVAIAPTILFLAGIFAGGATVASGIRSRKSRKALRF